MAGDGKFLAKSGPSPQPLSRFAGEGLKPGLHVAAVFAAYVVEGVADLAEAVGLDCLHQRFEHVLSLPRRVLEVRQSMPVRSEEHTSELQSLMRISYAVFCLKKKTTLKS